MSKMVSIILLWVCFLLVALEVTSYFSSQKSDTYLIVGSGFIQVFATVCVVFFEVSNFLLVIMEVFSFMLFFFLFSSATDSGFMSMLIIPMLLIMLSLMIQEIHLVGSVMYLKVFILGVVFKYGVIGGVIFFEFPSSMYGEHSKDSLNLFLYMVNSKFLLVLYGWFINSQVINLGMVSKSFFLNEDSNSYMLILLLLIGLLISSMYLLSLKDLEGYLLNSFCMAHLLLIVISFMEIKLFYVCLMWDIMLNVVYFLMWYVGKMNGFLVKGGMGKSLTMFLYMCQNVGVPPFPSFYLEVSFLGVSYLSLGGGLIGLGFMIVLCLIQSGQLMVFFYSFCSTPYYDGSSLNFTLNYEVWWYVILCLICYSCLWGCLFWFWA